MEDTLNYKTMEEDKANGSSATSTADVTAVVEMKDADTEVVLSTDVAPDADTPMTNGIYDETKNDDEDVSDPTTIKKQEDEVENHDDNKEMKASGKKRKKSVEEGETNVVADTGTTTTTGNSVTKRTGRERKSVETFNPESYDKVDKTVHIIDGRGTKIRNLSSTLVALIEKQSTEDIAFAHKLLYSSRYKVSKQDMVQQILDFNGYLPKKDTSLSKSEQEKLDDEFEGKIGAKAYKLTIPALKKLCDFFMVDRFGTSTKDGLVDKLLDFLGAPNKSFLKKGTVSKSSSSSSKSKTKTKTKKVKKTKDVDEDKEDNDDDEEEEAEEEEEGNDDGDKDGGDNDYDDVDDDKIKIDENDDDGPKLPSNETLRKWVRAYVRCFHQDKITVNHALEIGGDKFGINLLPKKGDLRKLLLEEL